MTATLICQICGLILLALALMAQGSLAQTTYKVTVKDENTKEPIVGATVTVRDTLISATTDSKASLT